MVDVTDTSILKVVVEVIDGLLDGPSTQFLAWGASLFDLWGALTNSFHRGESLFH